MSYFIIYHRPEDCVGDVDIQTPILNIRKNRLRYFMSNNKFYFNNSIKWVGFPLMYLYGEAHTHVHIDMSQAVSLQINTQQEMPGLLLPAVNMAVQGKAAVNRAC